MVLDYAITSLGIQQKKLSIKAIADSMGSTPRGGTSPARIEQVNILLKESVPNISFKQVILGTFQVIKEEIDAKRPVIAWINLLCDDDDAPWHAVIVNGYEDLRSIYYVDPNIDEEYSQKMQEIGAFVDQQLGRTGQLVKLVISEEGQKDLFGRVIDPKTKRKRQ